jgi:hypothetical protein
MVFAAVWAIDDFFLDVVTGIKPVYSRGLGGIGSVLVAVGVIVRGTTFVANAGLTRKTAPTFAGRQAGSYAQALLTIAVLVFFAAGVVALFSAVWATAIVFCAGAVLPSCVFGLVVSYDQAAA